MDEKTGVTSFEGRPFDPLLLLSRNAYHHGAEPLRIGVLPHVRRELDIRLWRFIAADIIFDLKLDNRPAPPAMRTLAVNLAPEITLFPDLPVHVRADPTVLASLVRMAARPKPRKP